MHRAILAALVALLIAVPSVAQNVWSFEARSLAMGNAVVGVADDSAAWLQNPAGLPYLQISPKSRMAWPMRISATTDAGLEVDTVGANASARDRAGRQGWGLGYWHLGDYELGPYISLSIERYGAGYGARISDEWSVGIAVADLEMLWDIPPMVMPGQSQAAIAAYNGRETIIDVGVMYRDVTEAGTAKFGLVARDVADNMQSTVDIGASFLSPEGLLLTTELRDATDAIDVAFNVGAEWRVSGLPELTLLAGLADGDATYGAGYDFMPWTVSLSTQHLDFATETAVTFCGSF